MITFVLSSTYFMRFLFVSLLPFLFLSACQHARNGLTKNFTQQEIDQIEYHFKDASVPPAYQRNFSLIVRNDSLWFTVDSYGTVLKDTFTRINNMKWNTCLNAFNACQIKVLTSSKKIKPCTGGSGIIISAKTRENRVFYGRYFLCEEISMTGDFSCFLETIKEGLSPGFYSLENP